MQHPQGQPHRADDARKRDQRPLPGRGAPRAVHRQHREAAEALDDIRKTAEEFDQSMGNIFGQHIELDLRINNQRMEDILGNPVGELQNQIDRYQEMLQDSTIPEEQKKWLQRQIDLMNDAIANGTSILDLNLQRLNEIAKYTEE